MVDEAPEGDDLMEEKKEKKMSTAKAVEILCERWNIGETKTGLQICKEVELILKANGSDEYPMQTNTLRRLREVDDSYGIHVVSRYRGGSVYRKDVAKEWIAKVIKGARA